MMQSDVTTISKILEHVQMLLNDEPDSANGDPSGNVWENKLQTELQNTSILEQECEALREEFDAQQKKRLEAIFVKMKPIIVRDEPSRKANYKIMAARLHYEIYALTQRLRLTAIRVEHEQSLRRHSEKEVRHLRRLISEKKTSITTATKGIPFTKLEVRPQDQIPSYSGPTEIGNPLLSGLPNATLMAAAKMNHLGSLIGTSAFGMPNMSGLPDEINHSLYSNATIPRIGTSQGSPTRSPKRSKATDIVEKKQNVNLDDEEEEEEEDDFE